jgi:predicted ester cyclase
MAPTGEQDLETLYRRYNRLCNAHRFDGLGEFVAQDVEVNGEVQGLEAYVDGLQAVVTAFPDYRWDLRHLFVSGAWVSAHFLDSGTHRGTFLRGCRRPAAWSAPRSSRSTASRQAGSPRSG